ncbi:CYTH and CHAD domain-containing protein [Tessaracoccus lubricantis]|uniref:CYTH and CHAD domain-containing protein n=1 Tax=Tessaracoccus lubricantis TaxID=545543 RepID=A0ABP9FIM8_9ACTN
MAEQLETEVKFALEEGGELPPLDGLVRAGAVHEYLQRAVYYDTLDLLLARHAITLRRRTGGSDDGWHLKLPEGGSARREVHADLDEAPGHRRVPGELVDAVATALGDAWPAGAEGALVPVSFLTTRRLETQLLADDGSVAALLSDDRVTALPAGLSMREAEVELVDGDESLLEVIEERFAEHDVVRSDSPSKLLWSLGDRPERAEAGEGPGGSAPAAVVVHQYLRLQAATLLGCADDLRADAEDAVHKARVAVRRLRSALRTFRRLFHRDVTDALRDELSWFADVLSVPRDAEVMRAHLASRLEALPDELVRGRVVERVRRAVDARHDAGHAALVETLDSQRYLRLVDALLDVLGDTPWRGRAHREARDVLPKLISKAARRAVRERDAAREAEGGQRLHLLHEYRKRAKAVRYAHEAVAPAFGDDAAVAAEAWEEVTDALGLVQDSVVAAQWLADFAAAADTVGESGSSYLSVGS